MREIICDGCGKYLGEIRDAKLAKGIKHACKDCSVSKPKSIFDEELDKIRRQRKLVDEILIKSMV